jgi:hypothetical protein
VPLTVFAEDRVLVQRTYEPPWNCGGGGDVIPAAAAAALEDNAPGAAGPEKDFGRRDGETTQEYLKREVRARALRPPAAQPPRPAPRLPGAASGDPGARPPSPPPSRPPAALQFSALKPFVVISLSYLLFTTTDGAIRMIVLLHAYNSGFSAWQVAIMFTLYELAGGGSRANHAGAVQEAGCAPPPPFLLRTERSHWRGCQRRCRDRCQRACPLAPPRRRHQPPGWPDGQQVGHQVDAADRAVAAAGGHQRAVRLAGRLGAGGQQVEGHRVCHLCAGG